MKDKDCVPFLQWALPRMQMSWSGFRTVRSQVCKRIDRRLHQLHLKDTNDYRDFLQQHDEEWSILESLCTVTISRFYRDPELFRYLENRTFPELAENGLFNGRNELSVWSIGCASGEEPYSIALLWDRLLKKRFPVIKLKLQATDINQTVLNRAVNGCYSFSSLKNLPAEWRDQLFSKQNELYCLVEEIKNQVSFRVHDIREPCPMEAQDLTLCRNLIFTYYDSRQQINLGRKLFLSLSEGGFLVIGKHEDLPIELNSLYSKLDFPGIYQKKIQSFSVSGT